MICQKCKYWELLSHYDAGNVGVCKHPLMYGLQSCSSPGVRDSEISKVIVGEFTTLTTRWNFGCNQHEAMHDALKVGADKTGDVVIDPNCTCDEHGACAYCWNGKKHDRYSDGMTAEDDKSFNRQWDVK